jgi:hypothetical protein
VFTGGALAALAFGLEFDLASWAILSTAAIVAQAASWSYDWFSRSKIEMAND